MNSLDHFSIDGTSDKAKALLEFLRTLEFVTKEKVEFALTDEHQALLEERRTNRMTGKTRADNWDDVKESLGKN